MTEKIEWYKEVLELEPNSKVFFPLARLLLQENRADEAIQVLKNGLDRHKEYLEARLLLIELLYQRGRREECDEQIRGLAKVLTAYAGFWQAWAACLASSEADTASTLRLLAAQFLCGPISLNDAVSRGVEEIIRERANFEKSAGAPKKSAEKTVSRKSASPEPVSQKTASDVGVPVEENKETAPGDAAIVSDAETTIFGRDSEEESPSLSLPEEEGSATLPLVEEMAKPSDAPHEGLKTEDGEAFPLSGAYDLEAGESVDYSDEDEDGGDEETPKEEHFSIRTRSMADVLASQGDFDGAIDIYRELLSSASAEEAEELKGRIASLKERKEQETSNESAPVSKEKLINILEALAQRVEERVNNPADI